MATLKKHKRYLKNVWIHRFLTKASKIILIGTLLGLFTIKPVPGLYTIKPVPGLYTIKPVPGVCLLSIRPIN